MVLYTTDDWGRPANISCWTMFAVTSIFVGLRIFCRLRFSRRIGGGLGLDDYITLLCLVVFVFTCAFGSTSYSYGLGKHFDTLPLEESLKALKWSLINCTVITWQFSLPKFAIVAVLGRILNYGTKTAVLLWGLAFLSQAGILVTSIWWVQQCQPVEYGWNKGIKGKCADVKILSSLGYFTSAFSAFLDVFFAVYPVKYIMCLHLPLKTRITIAVTLGASSLSAGVAIYKLTLFPEVFGIIPTDPTFPMPLLNIPAIAEGSLNIICASLPALGPLFSSFKKSITDSKTKSKSMSRPGGNGTYHSKNWDRLEDSSKSSRPRHSTDVVPLVDARQHGPVEIRKTLEISISSESFDHKGQTATNVFDR